MPERVPPPPAPRGSEPTAGQVTSILDPTWAEAAIRANFGFHQYTATSEQVSLTWEWAKHLIRNFNGVWGALWKGIDGTTRLALLVGQTFFDYWSKVLSPIWAKLSAVLLDIYDLAREVLGVAVQGLDYAVRSVIGPLLSWAGVLREAVARIPAVLRSARTLVLQVASAGELLVAVVEGKVHGAFGFFVGAYNEAVDWLNHLVDPIGIHRELPWVWSVWTYAGDLINLVVNWLVPDDIAARVQRWEARWPLFTLLQQVQDFAAGSTRARAELDAAAERFRSGAI